jgi:hypothetical protein
MLLRTFLLCLLLCIWKTEARASGYPLVDKWYSGRIFLKNGDTKSGLIAYDADRGFTLLKEGQKIKAFNVRQVESFEIMDFETHTFRWFYSLPYQERGKKNELFFELLVDAGKLALLSRETLVNVNDSGEGQRFHWESFTATGDIFYLLDKNTASVSLLPGNADRLQEFIGENKEVIQHYIKAHKLDLASRKDLIKLFYYVRTLQQEEGENIEAAILQRQ